MKMKRIHSLTFLSLIFSSAFAQMPSLEKRDHTGDRYTREANIKYAKRIDRVIDNRMKQNKVLEWPGEDGYPLSKILWDGLWGPINEAGPIETVYQDPSLQKAYDKDTLRMNLSVSQTFQVWDTVLQDFVDSTIQIPFDPDKITKFRLREDWLFDANYSDFRPHIIAMAPLYPMPTQSGFDLGEIAAYWIDFKDLEPILAAVHVFNPHNRAARLTVDQFFQMRMFASTIVKEENVFDTDIAQTEPFEDDGIAALLEADRIKNDLFILEHDLWEY